MSDSPNFGFLSNRVIYPGNSPLSRTLSISRFFFTLKSFTHLSRTLWTNRSVFHLSRTYDLSAKVLYSNYATDVGTYLSEQDEMGKVGKKLRDTDTVLVTLQNLDLLSTSLTSP